MMIWNKKNKQEEKEEGLVSRNPLDHLDHYQRRTLLSAVVAAVVLYSAYAGGFVFTALITSSCIVMLLEWWQMSRKKYDIITGIFSIIPGLLFIIGPCAAMVLIRNVEEENMGQIVTLWMFATVLATHLGSFMSETAFETSPKILPKIAPNTWAGLYGAMAMAAGVSAICMFGIKGAELKFMSLGLVFGIIVGILAQAGDIFIGFVKKKFGVRKSGNIVLGESGVLDNVSGLLFVVPIMLLLLFVMS